MRSNISNFMNYLHDVKKISKNTELSYERDLRQMADYFEGTGRSDVRDIDEAALLSYIDYLNSQGKKSSTISRSIASMRAFFLREYKLGNIDSDITSVLKAPKISRTAPVILSTEEVDKILAQPGAGTDKEIRDKAMLELLYATGIRVTELVSIKLEDVDLASNKIRIINGNGNARVVPINRAASRALRNYIGEVRNRMMGECEQETLFINCSGSPMSRQGFWKIIKHYAKKAGIEADITPHTLRHSFAAHMIHSGADVHTIQTMMGHSDISSTQMYVRLEDELHREYIKNL